MHATPHGAAPVRQRQPRTAWPLARWPDADRHAWEQARSPGGLLDDAGLAAGWRPSTVNGALAVYGRFLAFLDREGLLDATHGVGDRLTPDVLKRYVAELQGISASRTVASYAVMLDMVLRALAPGPDWGWLRRATLKLLHRAEPSRNKRARVVPAADLLTLGLDLMHAAEAETGLTHKDQLLAFRDGLMIATLISRPLRQSNFLGIEIGRHLLQVSAGSGWDLVFAASETKACRDLEVSYPPELAGALRHYLGVVRPGLLALGRTRFPHGREGDRPAGQHLWVSVNGTALRKTALDNMLAKRTTARLGRRINTHLFRDCAATSIMTEVPGQVRIAARVLGHATLQTTERHYIVANTRREVSRYQKDVLARRRHAAKRARKPGQARMPEGGDPLRGEDEQAGPLGTTGVSG